MVGCAFDLSQTWVFIYVTSLVFFFNCFRLNLWFVGLGIAFNWNFFCHEISILFCSFEWFLVLL
jgi:hypothetical protein